MGIGTKADRGGSAVLEDPTGRRARWLRGSGRCVFVLFLGWLLAIVLGGLGLMPVAAIPFVHVLRPSQGPPALPKLPQAQQPSVSDLRPALPEKVFAARVRKGHQQAASSAIGLGGRGSSVPGHAGVSPGRNTTAPGRTKTSPTSVATHARSVTAPGQTKTRSTSTIPSNKP